MSENDPTLRDLLTEGLEHEDSFVRESCLRYWEDQPDRGATQARRIIDALQAYGLRAFRFPRQAGKIPLDRSCFEQLITTLRETPCSDARDTEYCGCWFRWCLSAEDEMLPEVEAFLRSDQALAFEVPGISTLGDLLERVERRRRYASLDAETCHAEIQKAFASIESADKFPHEAVREVECLLDQLIKVESFDRVTELARSWLALNPTIDQEAEDAEDSDVRDDYKFSFGVYLAGELGLTSAVDRIIDGVAQTDWDWLNETSAAAVAKLPPAKPTARLRARWWHSRVTVRLFFSDVFTIAHLPEHRDFYLENMARLEEHEFDIIPHRMARALALLGDPESVRAATEYWQANEDDRDAFEVAETVYTIHRVRGEDAPILEPIRERLLEDEARYERAQERLAEIAEQWQRKERLEQNNAPVVRTNPKIGRNDPCPCGSGKKYKQCCLNS